MQQYKVSLAHNPDLEASGGHSRAEVHVEVGEP